MGKYNSTILHYINDNSNIYQYRHMNEKKRGNVKKKGRVSGGMPLTEGRLNIPMAAASSARQKIVPAQVVPTSICILLYMEHIFTIEIVIPLYYNREVIRL